MTRAPENQVNVLRLTLQGRLVGYLAGYLNGRSLLSFADEFRYDLDRPTFSLITHPSFSRADQLMAEPWARSQRLHPVLSNLLPEGALREFIAQLLKVSSENEFSILSFLGRDLPGALVAEPMEPDEVPGTVLRINGGAQATKFDQALIARSARDNRFSLAGVQMKFSMKEKEGRYNLSLGDQLGDWIIKTPSTQHQDVPLNEFTAMTLASLVGIDIPEIKLVEMSHLDNLPPINLPDETLAFAIKRFDRRDNLRVHMEDFAQVLVKYPHEKYNSASYEQIGKILFEFSGNGLADTQQFARRLLVNILLANGDAHLKNWSLLYADQITPRLSPAYDILATHVYIQGEKQFALNLGKTKDWYGVTLQNFQYWAEKSGIPWRAIKPHLDDVMTKAKTLWPDALKNLPMNEKHKAQLILHWKNLAEDFRVNS